MFIADYHAFIQRFQNGLLLRQQAAQRELLPDSFRRRLHRTQGMRVEVIRRGGQREHANQLAAAIPYGRGGALPPTLAQIKLPVLAAQHVDQALFNQATRCAVGPEHLFAQNAANRRQICAAKIQRYASRVGEVDMAVRIIGQQIFHDTARHQDQFGVVFEDGGQFTGGRSDIDKTVRIDGVLLRTLPRLQNTAPQRLRLLALQKALPALPQQIVPAGSFRAIRQAKDGITLFS